MERYPKTLVMGDLSQKPERMYELKRSLEGSGERQTTGLRDFFLLDIIAPQGKDQRGEGYRDGNIF